MRDRAKVAPRAHDPARPGSGRIRSGAMAPRVTGLAHVQVAAPAGCEAAARRFYGELLGLLEVPKPPGVAASGGVWFAVGGQELHVGVDPAFLPARKAHPGLTVADGQLDALAAALGAAGHAVSWDDRIPERRRFYATDPWGNRVELTA